LSGWKKPFKICSPKIDKELLLLSAIPARCSLRLAFRGFFQLTRKLLDALTHNLASFKFHRCSRWNHETAARLIWIPANSGFCQPRLKNAKIPQLNRNIVGQTICDFIERPLNYIEDLMLDHSRLIADRDDDVALG